MNVITKNGFQCELDDNALNDWEVLEVLREIDQGDPTAIVEVPKLILSSDDQKALRAFCRDERGKIAIDKMVSEITGILEAAKAGKNS